MADLNGAWLYADCNTTTAVAKRLKCVLAQKRGATDDGLHVPNILLFANGAVRRSSEIMGTSANHLIEETFMIATLSGTCLFADCNTTTAVTNRLEDMFFHYTISDDDPLNVAKILLWANGAVRRASEIMATSPNHLIEEMLHAIPLSTRVGERVTNESADDHSL